MGTRGRRRRDAATRRGVDRHATARGGRKPQRRFAARRRLLSRCDRPDRSRHAHRDDGAARRALSPPRRRRLVQLVRRRSGVRLPRARRRLRHSQRKAVGQRERGRAVKRVVLALALLLGIPAFAAGAPGEYALTVYANDELPWGHVFFKLTDGTAEIVRGFYPHKRGPGALAGYNGGDVRDDMPTRWTARKQYPLDAAAYRAAMRAVGAQYGAKPDR